MSLSASCQIHDPGQVEPAIGTVELGDILRFSMDLQWNDTIGSMAAITKINAPRIAQETLESRPNVSISDLVASEEGILELSSVNLSSTVLNLDVEMDIEIYRSALDRVDLSRQVIRSVLQSRITDCRLLGTELEGIISDVHFLNSHIELASFRECHLRRVIFERCTFVDADFYRARMSDVSFRDSVINGIGFDHTTIQRVDLRSSTLAIGDISSLAGCLVTPDQAMGLAVQAVRKLGLLVDID